MKDISLYIHIPFCSSKCYYCDFYSLVADDEAKQKFKIALIKEINKYKKLLQERLVKTIYIGGGTPSVMASNFFVDIKKALDKCCKYSKNLEFTVEVNPNSFSENLAKTFLSIGVNRISIGLQSANEKLLKAINRKHSFKQFEESCNIINKYFNNFSIDVMVGLPNQKIKDVKYALKKMLKFKPKHISCYDLIIEENTPLATNQTLIKLIPNENYLIKMNKIVYKLLNKFKFQRYKVSNYSLIADNDEDRYISKHNCMYWNGGDYLGLGPSAHSFINGYRFYNERDFNLYLQNNAKSKKELITKNKIREEKIMLGLRTKWGCAANLCNKMELENLINKGFVVLDNGFVKVTEKGINVLNLIVLNLI